MLNLDVISGSLPFILEGGWVTLKFAIGSLLCGLPLGVMLGLAKVSKKGLLKCAADVYTSIFRGTPLLVQLGLIYFSTPQLTGYAISAFEAGLIAFSLNSAAYTSETIRSGITSIDQGQWEACHILGMTYSQTMFHVILPQAFRNILPALVNEMINLLKESALVSTIGEMELYRRAQMVASEKYLYFEPFLVVAIVYYVLVSLMTYLATYLERRLQPC